MKFFRICTALIALGILSSCYTTRNVSFQSLEPARLDMPTGINKIVLINRTTPAAKAGRFIRNIEGLFSGEGIAMDKEAIQAGLVQVQSELNLAPKYTAEVNQGVYLRPSGLTFPPPMAWAMVDSICAAHGAQALLALEVLDSDAEILPEYYDGPRPNRRLINVQTRWRLYLAERREVLDEFSQKYTVEQQSFYVYSDRQQRHTVQALARDQAVELAWRISPHQVTHLRKWYSRRKSRLEDAMPLVVANDWDGAVKHWQTMLLDPAVKKKDKKRAAYNIAVAHEYTGQLDLALRAAQDAVQLFRFRSEAWYVPFLNRRIIDQRRVEQQMAEVE